MNEIEVTLPVCKGTVWLRSRLSDGRMDALNNTYAMRLPSAAMSAIALATEEGKLTDEPDDDTLTRFLLARGYGGVELRAARKAADREVVHIVVKRWANVRGPEDDAPLDFPDGLADMDPDDFAFLLGECWAAVAKGRADPNDGAPPSAPGGSEAARANGTASDGRDSPSTSETLYASTQSMAATSA